MKVVPALLVLCCSCGGEAGAAPAPQSRRAEARGPEAPQEPRRALLVGVGRYHPDSQRDEDGERMFPDLKGPPQDLELVEHLLRSRFGFRQEDILVLQDEEATLENVVRAFHEHLVSGCTSETEVLFWYSGHGSTVPDGRERIGFDNTLVLHDSRAGGSSGERDLVDDALHSLVAALPTERVTVITDCCHSAGGLRSGEASETHVVRTAPRGNGIPLPMSWFFWPEDVPLLDDDDSRRARAPRYVHVAACSFEQRAFEVELPEPPPGYGGKEFGALTWYLAREMAEAAPGTSWRTVVGRARLHVAAVLPDQRVSVEGGGAGRSLFDEEVHDTLFGFDAHPGYAGRILVEAGGLHGLREASEVAVYRLGERQPLGQARITHCQATKATAEWIGEAPELETTEALVVTRGSLGAGEMALSVAVEDGAARGALGGIPWLLPVTDRADCEYRLAREEDAWTLSAVDGAEIWRWESVDPEPGSSEPDAWHDEAALRDLEHAARDEVHFRRIWDLAEAAGMGALSIEARFAAPSREECAGLDSQQFGLTGFRPLDLPEGAGALREVGVRLKSFEAQVGGPGDLVKVEVEAGARDVFVAILNLDQAARSIELDFPNPEVDEKDNLLRAGGKLWRYFSVGAPGPDRWPSDRPCRDRYLVIATRDRVDFRSLETRERTRGGGPADVLESLAGLDWGVAAVDLLIERAQ